jgi:hypothetical protein
MRRAMRVVPSPHVKLLVPVGAVRLRPDAFAGLQRAIVAGAWNGLQPYHRAMSIFPTMFIDSKVETAILLQALISPSPPSL